jgi:hypothetical protein
MCLSNDGVFDTEAWQPYATNASWNLTNGDELKHVYVLFKDPTENVSSVVTASITLDTHIASLAVTPTMVAQGDLVTVSVSTANSILRVTANGVDLTPNGADWTGQVLAAGPNGLKTVEIIATDDANNPHNRSATYKVASIVAAGGNSITNAATSASCGDYLFLFCGKVANAASDGFSVDDGSGITLKVIAPGYTGIADGDFATARGILNPLANPVTLTCPADKVAKRN